MKKFITYILVLLICISAVLPVGAVTETEYSDGYTKIGDVAIPFAEHMPGTYFTKNGQACTCHRSSAINCVASGPNCNCLRYVTVGDKEIDLLAVQCIGFARYCFYRLFGFVDHDYNTKLYYNAGTLEKGQVTETAVKKLITSLKPGAHIRFKLSGSQHSVILLSQNSAGFTVYQCNSALADCIISTKAYTWAEFASYATRGIVFAHMPNNYPENVQYSDTPFEGTVTPSNAIGKYTTMENLNVRAGTGTEHNVLATLPKGTVVYVNSINNNWGLITYKGTTGWISLDYAKYLGPPPSLTPKENSGITIDNGCIYGVDPCTSTEKLLACFESADSLTVSGTTNELVGTGTLICITEGEATFEYTVIVNGDVNGDGDLTTADLILIKTHLINTNVLNGVFYNAADINGNGALTTADYKKLTFIISKKPLTEAFSISLRLQQLSPGG